MRVKLPKPLIILQRRTIIILRIASLALKIALESLREDLGLWGDWP